MLGVTYISAKTFGHGCWPSTIIAQGCSTVIVEGKAASTLGHIGFPHTCTAPPFPTHPTLVGQGSTTVYAEGAALARIGDMMFCTDIIAEGCGTVLGGG